MNIDEMISNGLNNKSKEGGKPGKLKTPRKLTKAELISELTDAISLTQSVIETINTPSEIEHHMKCLERYTERLFKAIKSEEDV